MKNFLNYACVFAAVLSMASCQKNEVLTEDDYVTATFTIEAPAELSTKAIGDGTTAKNLVFAVYPYDSRLTDDQNDLAEELTDLRKGDWTANGLGDKQPVTFTTGADGRPTATVKVTLLRGKEYQFVCWAQCKDVTCYDFADMKNIKVDYAGAVSQDETRDAFYAWTPTKDDQGNVIKVSQGFKQTIILRRPFAQVNVGATDMEAAKSAGLDITKIQSKMTVVNVATTLNTFTGATSGSTTADFSIKQAVSPTEDLTINASGYENQSFGWLAMNYVLPSESNTNIVFFLYDENSEELCSYEVTNEKLQQNFRTHLLGEVLTTEGTITVVIEPAFLNDDKVVAIQ